MSEPCRLRRGKGYGTCADEGGNLEEIKLDSREEPGHNPGSSFLVSLR